MKKDSCIIRNLRDFEVFSNKNSLCIIGLLLCGMIAIDNSNHRKELEQVVAQNEITLKKTRHGNVLALIPNDYNSNIFRKNTCYEPHVTNLLTSYAKHGDTVVECGAHIGYYTTLLAKLISKSGHIYSYEGNPEVVQLTNLSVKMNCATDIVNLKNYCVSNSNNVLDFLCMKTYKNDMLNESHTSISRIYEGSKDNTYNHKILKVQAVSLDEDLSDVQQIDWLRMDIEGAEILAIQGAKRLIENSPNLKIVTEWHPEFLSRYGAPEELVDYLFSQGFSAYKITQIGGFGEKLSKEQLLAPQHSDLIFVRDETKAQMTVNPDFIPVQDLPEQTFDILK